MNLFHLLRQRAGKPVRVGIIGAGKFGSMFLAQARRTVGLHVVGVADRYPERAREALARVGWPTEQFAVPTLAAAAASDTTCVTDDADALVRTPELDVLIEATGSPPAGIRDALAAIEARIAGSARILVRPSGTQSLIRVMVEADDEALLDEVMQEIILLIEGCAKKSQ